MKEGGQVSTVQCYSNSWGCKWCYLYQHAALNTVIARKSSLDGAQLLARDFLIALLICEENWKTLEKQEHVPLAYCVLKMELL